MEGVAWCLPQVLLTGGQGSDAAWQHEAGRGFGHDLKLVRNDYYRFFLFCIIYVKEYFAIC